MAPHGTAVAQQGKAQEVGSWVTCPLLCVHLASLVIAFSGWCLQLVLAAGVFGLCQQLVSAARAGGFVGWVVRIVVQTLWSSGGSSLVFNSVVFQFR